jgi:hypothetical protein
MQQKHNPCSTMSMMNNHYDEDDESLYRVPRQHPRQPQQRRRSRRHRRTPKSTLCHFLSSSKKFLSSPSATFWILGLLNNASYVIMLACAKTISEGGTALVFLANILPGMTMKLSGPYWFDKVHYTTRMRFATGCMLASFSLIATLRTYVVAKQQEQQQEQQQQFFEGHNGSSIGSTATTTTSINWILYGQLLGVALASCQTGLGEASLLALAGKYDSQMSQVEDDDDDETFFLEGDNDTVDDGFDDDELVRSRPDQSEATSTSTTSSRNNNNNNKGTCLTCFASGTGLAGVFGFFWKWFWNDWLAWSLSSTLWMAWILAFAYWTVYRYSLDDATRTIDIGNAATGSQSRSTVGAATTNGMTTNEHNDGDDDTNETSPMVLVEQPCGSPTLGSTEGISSVPLPFQPSAVLDVARMTTWQRTQLIASLWPYMIPLFVVYATEYALQAGTWTAIGFPSVQDKAARNEFYQYSNWMYQAGVFVSRSSGTLFTVPLWILWLMPFLQSVNVVVFGMVATVGTTKAGAMLLANAATTTVTTTTLSGILTWAYHPGVLYPLCFYVGLLGGGVYISGYKRICVDLPLQHREFALSTTSASESLGIVLADVVGLFLQSCLYQWHGLPGAVVTCPVGQH